MMEYKINTILIISVLLSIPSATAVRRNPLRDSHICGRPQCSDKDNKFKYEINSMYRYDYSMYVKNQFAGSSENVSELHLTAVVELQFFQLCEGVLRLSNVELRSKAQPQPFDGEEFPEDYVEPEEVELHSKSESLAEDMQNFELIFAFHDGVIGEVCPNEEEKIWVLNLKKGILSSFQNSMKRFDIDYHTTETDVSGTCDVNYSLVGVQGTSLVINKAKDISSCRSRYKTHSFLQTTPYDFRQNYAAWPILNSESHCNISIDHHVYSEVTCYEKHILVPFSNNATGAVTESMIKMVLTEEVTSDPYADENELIEHRSSLLFDHTPSERPTHGEMKSTREYLKQMCQYGFPNIQRDFSTVFTSFLSSAKSLTYPALQQLLARATSICSNGKKHVIESLPFIASTASVQLMRDQIVDKLVTPEVAQSWLSSIAFLTRPNGEIMEAMHSLLEYGQSIDEPEFTLVTTAVVNTYCRQNSNCENVEGISGMVDILENVVRTKLEVGELNRKSFEQVIIALKGLGNMGVIRMDFQEDLYSLITDEDRPIEMRLQAVYTFRRSDCLKTRDYFLDLYQNFTIQSEVRIASYLQTMKCPDYLTIKVIKDVLETEIVNQVGSFVWSHLTSLSKSSSPSKVEIQGLLVNGDFGTKFRMDMRKFSRNYENSLFFDEYNFGGTTDSNLIFSTDSYIPRSASFNLTADLFGESINLFEFNTRIQGFEHFAELLTGPKGPLSTDKLMEFVEMFTRYFQEDEPMSSFEQEDDDTDVRRKRDTYSGRVAKEELEESIKQLPYKMKHSFVEPEASIGIKVFGNDLTYKTMRGYAEVMAAASKLNPVDYIKEILSGREVTYTKSGVFLDTSYEVPLSSGLPLAVHVLGASSVDLRLSGSLKTEEIQNLWKIDAEGKIKPSVSLDVIASMQSDFYHTGTGIKVKSNLYSSSEIEAKLKIRGTQLVSFHFSLPQKRNDIFSARSTLIVMENDKEIVQSGIPKRYSNATCSWPLINRAVGLKICSEYSLPDVSTYEKLSPSLILSGPVNLDVHLDKADPTAKNFSFEYRYDVAKEKNAFKTSFTFETPGSQIPRVLTSNLISNQDGFNVSMGFRNGDTVHSAIGIYKTAKLSKKFDISITIDNREHFTLEMDLNKTELKYGAKYFPKMLLTVNGDKIAGLIGSYRITYKKEISQVDVDLQFETKKLKATLYGNLMKSETLTSTKFNLNYQFLSSKPENVEFESQLADKSQKSNTDYRGLLKLNSTAYPNFNFASSLIFLSSQGHVDCTLALNNAPDLLDPNYTLTLRLLFARYHITDGTRTSAAVELTRPKSKADVKIQIKHEEKLKKGLDHNVLIVVRYAPGKEVTTVLSLLFPKRNLFALDAALNIKVPDFDSCVVNLKIYEKIRKEYNINFDGLWFSGHKIKLDGLYQDRTSAVKSYHHLKMIAESPSFEETDIDIKYSNDEYELKFDVNVEYAKQPYGVQIKYSEASDSHTLSYGELRYRDKLYWISADMLLDQPKQLTVEIHIDKIRDIHVILRGLSNQLKKELGVEFKWNANRDPTQRLIVSAQFNTPEKRMYDGGFLMAYPDRSFSGTFDLDAVGPVYNGKSRLGWSATEAIEFNFNGGYKPGQAIDVWLVSVFNTPFDGWKRNTMNSGFYYINNLLLFNSTLLWADDQRLGFEVMGDYDINDTLFSCEFKASLNSTVHDVPTASAYFKHRYDEKKIDTEITVRHLPINETLQMFSILSAWQIGNDHRHRNISGSLVLRSPFEGYTKGALMTKFSFSDTKQLWGAADLDLEEKHFTLTVQGHLRKLTDNMLVVNITTPIEKFRSVVGRFGLNEREKHLVAEVRYPGGTLGIEILFVVINLSDFDVKFNLATPLEALEKVMVIGKMNLENVDLRVGWDKVMLGFIGVWRKNNIKDFEYSYKVYTPLKNLEENGVVVKFIMKEGVDMELTMKFAQYKLGATVFGKPKPMLIRELRLEKMYKLIKEFEENGMGAVESSEESSSESDDEDDEEEDPISFDGYMELDTLIWPTLKGNLDVDQIDESYISFGTIILPQGVIEIRDRFYMLNYAEMKNKLKITTPFPKVKEIKSNYECNMIIGSQYIIGFDVAIRDRKWTECGFHVNYTTATDDAELKTHEVILQFKTLITNLPTIWIRGIVELEESIYRGNFTTKTDNTELSLAGSFENDDKFLDTSFGLTLSTLVIPMYGVKMGFKKYFSEIDNSIAFSSELNDNYTLYYMRMETEWHKESAVIINAKSKIETNAIPLSSVNTAILIKKAPHPSASFELLYADTQGAIEEIKATASREGEKVHVELLTPVLEFKNLTLIGQLSETTTKGVYDVTGDFYQNSNVYHVQGSSVFLDALPVKVNLQIKSPQSNQNGIIYYSIERFNEGKGTTVTARFANNNKYAQLGSGFNFENNIDWSYFLEISSSESEMGLVAVNASSELTDTRSVIGRLRLASPWDHLGIGKVEIDTDARILRDSGETSVDFKYHDITGKATSSWSWVIMENMQYSYQVQSRYKDIVHKEFKTALRYINPKKNMQQLSIGGDLNVDNLWVLSTDGSLLFKSANDIEAKVTLKLPKPVGDDHLLRFQYLGNFKENIEVSYDISYDSVEARNRLASRGIYRNTTDAQGLLRVEWGHNKRGEAIETNVHMLRKGIRKELSATLSTPFYQEDTLTASGSYDYKDIFHMLKGSLNVPASNKVAESEVAFSSLSNMKGMAKGSAAFLNISWIRGDFDFSTVNGQSIRFLKASWPNNHATFDSKSSFSSNKLERDHQGVIKLEIPLETRHYASMVYGLKERALITTGHATVEYNSENVLNGHYTCKSEARAGHEKDVVDITLENKLKPLGVHYVHLHQYGVPGAPVYDMKRAEVFELKNNKKFNITGEIHVTNRETGQEYKIVAVHPNRTVILTSDYDYQENTTKHRSKLQLAPNVWFGYDVMMENLTHNDNESQIFSVELSYPKRNLSAEGWYGVTEDALDSDLTIRWTETDASEEKKGTLSKAMRAAIQWKNEPALGLTRNNQSASLTLRHPSLEKDIEVKGWFYRDPTDLLKTKLVLDYAKDVDHLLTLVANVRDLSKLVRYRNYTIDITGQHVASSLDLHANGSVGARTGIYEILHEGHYKRSYLPMQNGLLIGLIDLRKKEIHYHKQTPYKNSRLWGKYSGNFPAYSINGTFEDSPDYNFNGEFYLNIEGKLVKMELNMTPDASQNLQMYGIVPDSRSAFFDIWRNYDDIRVVDVAYYLRMNHSRLITSQLIWRPTIKTEVKEQVKLMAYSVYNSMAEGIDFWVKTFYIEATDTVNDIWNSAKPFAQGALDDVAGLRVLEEDLDELRNFLNESYHADDFYIRSVVNFTITVLDELALKNHFESFPKIIREFWQVMGDSGQALRKSILWLIETMKTSYKKTIEVIGRILHGESLEHLSAMMEKAVEKYDKFIKDLHLSFIKYVQNLWDRVTETLHMQFKKMLENVKPHILHLIHYVETVAWNISKEMFDFVYQRTNELVDSPYFSQVSNFTQDLDRLYKDFMGNDAFTNIKKYSGLAWKFIKGKYFKLVPFAKELNDLFMELYGEIRKLGEVESVQIVLQKINEVQAQLEWLADEFQVEKRLHELFNILRNKLSRFAQTALEADNYYREAKTKFIFDPDTGIIELQQKLPMSWHAFNETPKFEEIPEYKVITDVQNFFSSSNTSIWSLYYDLKPICDANMWLPPFKSHSILIGSRHYMTFDKNFVTLNLDYALLESDRKPHQCSYLMAHDYTEQNHFTLILEPSIYRNKDDLISTRKLTLLSEFELIDIDISSDAIRIGRNLTTSLPAKVGDLVIYRDADILTLESSKGFVLQCNLQFDVCVLELSGWYFGKTAGILGTMNNEFYDDLTRSDMKLAQNKDEFVNSWALPQCQESLQSPNATLVEMKATRELREMCDTFFKSKSSYFSSCFPIVNAQPFYDMCLDLGTHSLSNFIDEKKPIVKGACTSALAYIEACEIEKTPMRVPDSCVHCDLINGTFVPEGSFVSMKDEEIPQTTDVVFIIEAKPCNKDLSTKKSLLLVVNALSKELENSKLRNNRYAVVVFGGESPYDKPRSIIVNNEVFTDPKNLPAYFNHIHFEDGSNNDTFQAISIASKLIFRPGASKTFILMPCSRCSTRNMKFDYSSMLQLLLENGITLHILMDKDLPFTKTSASRVVYGMDRKFAFTKNDVRGIVGDTEFRKLVRTPKNELGLCAPLSIETNGTIFQTSKLKPERHNPYRKVSTVFAKRVAQTAKPNPCQTCECTGHNTGVAYMSCAPCNYPSPMSFDYEGFNEDEMLSVLQPGNDFNWEWEEDEEIAA